jgi:hypothetical protein
MKLLGSKLRDELLALAMFDTMPAARIPVERWQRDYNRSSPHGALGCRMCPGLPGRGKPFGPFASTDSSQFRYLQSIRSTGNLIYWQFDLLAIRSTGLAAQQNRFDIISNFMEVEECTGN